MKKSPTELYDELMQKASRPAHVDFGGADPLDRVSERLDQANELSSRVQRAINTDGGITDEARDDAAKAAKLLGELAKEFAEARKKKASGINGTETMDEFIKREKTALMLDVSQGMARGVSRFGENFNDADDFHDHYAGTPVAEVLTPSIMDRLAAYHHVVATAPRGSDEQKQAIENAQRVISERLDAVVRERWARRVKEQRNAN